jgi:hypothetical protein
MMYLGMHFSRFILFEFFFQLLAKLDIFQPLFLKVPFSLSLLLASFRDKRTHNSASCYDPQALRSSSFFSFSVFPLCYSDEVISMVTSSSSDILFCVLLSFCRAQPLGCLISSVFFSSEKSGFFSYLSISLLRHPGFPCV